MKINIKALLTLLCIGLYNHTSCMNPFATTIQKVQDTFLSKLQAYQPTYDSTTKTGITANWARALVQRLSDEERVALIYECLNLPINQDANNAWRTRDIGTFISTYAEITKNITANWAGKALSVPTAIASTLFSPFKRAYGYFTEYSLPSLDGYLNDNKNSYRNGEFDINWLNHAIEAANLDLQSYTTLGKLSPQQQSNRDAQIDLVLEKLMPIIEESKTINEIIAPIPTQAIKEHLQKHIIIKVNPFEQAQLKTAVTPSQTTTNPFAQSQQQRNQTNPFLTAPAQQQQQPTQPQLQIRTTNPFAQQQQPKSTPQIQPKTTQQQQGVQQQIPITISPTDKLMLTSLPLTNDAINWINQFIQNAQNKKQDRNAARMELINAIEIKGSTRRKDAAIAHVTRHFDSQWK